MKKTDIVKLALSGWKLSDIKELVELEKTMNEIDSKEPEPEPEPEPENDKYLKMLEVIKKLQDGNTRQNVEPPKNEEDILKDMFRDFM